MPINIKSHAVADTAVLHLNDETGEKLYDDGEPVTVEVYGPGSKVYLKAQSENEDRLINRMATGKSKQVDSPEAKARRQAEFLADTTVKFNGLGYEELQGREMHVAIYGDSTIGFIAKQVREFQADWANFTKGSTKS